MNNFLFSVIFVVLLFFSGFLAVEVWWSKYLNVYEKIGSAIGVGLIINFINVFALSVLKINIDPINIFLTFMLWLVPLLANTLKTRWCETDYRSLIKEVKKINILSLGILITILTVFYITIYNTLSSGFNSWDEFSFWGKAARLIYNNRTIFIQAIINPEASGHPTLWPASAGTMAIFSGGFVENYVKLLTPLLFFSLTIFIFGYIRRQKINFNGSLLLTTLFVMSSQVLIQYSSTLYAETIFTYYYAIGTLILLRLLFEETERGLLWVGLFFLSSLVLTKRGGIIPSFITIFSVYFFHLKNIIKEKKYKIYLILPLVVFLVQILWTLLSKIAGETLSPFATPSFQNIGYGISILPLMIKRMIVIFNSKSLYTIFWPIATFSAIIGAILFRKKIYFSIIVIFILNVAYLIAAYLAFFGKAEILTLHSFERYILPIFPIFFFSIIFLYKDINRLIISKIKGVRDVGVKVKEKVAV